MLWTVTFSKSTLKFRKNIEHSKKNENSRKKTANFSGTFKFFTMFEKKCSGYLIPPRYEIQFLQFLQLFFVDLFFSEKNGLTVCQNFLLSMIFFSFKFTNYCFFFLRRDTQKLHCLA